MQARPVVAALHDPDLRIHRRVREADQEYVAALAVVGDEIHLHQGTRGDQGLAVLVLLHARSIPDDRDVLAGEEAVRGGGALAQDHSPIRPDVLPRQVGDPLAEREQSHEDRHDRRDPDDCDQRRPETGWNTADGGGGERGDLAERVHEVPLAVGQRVGDAQAHS